MIDPDRLQAAYHAARARLLAERAPEGHWVGELASSALSTATAVGALALLQRVQPTPSCQRLIDNGLHWLTRHQNPDGGWGDTDRSYSNVSTTSLCRAAYRMAGGTQRASDVVRRAEAYLDAKCGVGPANHAEAIRARYGMDRTFSVPILTMGALTGLVSWKEIPRLPFELACFPQSCFRFLRLPVVSYALPALIALGQAIEHHRPSLNPFRRLAKAPSLRVLERIQPTTGGFLEATPLTSFVVMSLISIGQHRHPVVEKGVAFLKESVRPDGSWPIDTNLSLWGTTLAINALASAGDLAGLDAPDKLCAWLLSCQYQERHPYTGAEPGGWSWTYLSGGVPDADDTPGALIALANLLPRATDHPAARTGLRWLADLQNSDGGWPTFCRGWGKLPFDRSGADLTAHALRAIAVWLRRWHGEGFLRADDPLARRSIPRGLHYLERTQRSDGAWLPLWFGNQDAPHDENPTYGTARVLAAYRDLGLLHLPPAKRGLASLLSAQNADGSWGGAMDVAGSVEETSVVVDLLLGINAGPSHATQLSVAGEHGVTWLIAQVEAGGLEQPSPIGLYFAKLWYYERLYPIIFATAALGRALRVLTQPTDTRLRVTSRR